MAKHRVPKEGRSLFGSRKRDSLFERSFTQCSGCGDDVYVLAEDCRSCGVVLNETRLQEPVRPAQPAAHAQPVPQGLYAQLTRQSQPVQPQPAPQAQPARRPVRQPRAVHWAQLASQARMAAVSGEVRLRAS